ncbi:MAG TPA: hypothetical protein VM165_04345 [Planctomycetaceae bacterium]|nr:hypothetical protein [Planctomycetaceae bacterium]
MNVRHGWCVMGHVAALLASSFGCEAKKEPVLKIETPKAKIEVNQAPNGGSVEIQTERPTNTPANP